MTTTTDQILLQRHQEGDKVSFEALFYRHYDRVYGLLFRLLGSRAEAEDVTQDVFIKLYRRPLSGSREHNLSAWLYRVATNMGYNHIRGRKRRWGRDLVLLPEKDEGITDPSEEATKEESRALVRAALTRLKPRQAQLLLLRQMDFSYAELAEVLAVAPGSVGTLLSRAGEAFREAYRQEAGGEHPLPGPGNGPGRKENRE